MAMPQRLVELSRDGSGWTVVSRPSGDVTAPRVGRDAEFAGSAGGAASGTVTWRLAGLRFSGFDCVWEPGSVPDVPATLPSTLTPTGRKVDPDVAAAVPAVAGAVEETPGLVPEILAGLPFAVTPTARKVPPDDPAAAAEVPDEVAPVFPPPADTAPAPAVWEDTTAGSSSTAVAAIAATSRNVLHLCKPWPPRVVCWKARP
ncbi:MAG: hypothetical protein V4625_04565 [Pseudomonadota bacterium]